ncbi:hypothetical protein BKA62DRAFT_690214 [Auriculariales sp. MPI-PUGE-AT-0066]|nr:hypothetical protein BKA62DRAFT_690214 [Auriculariales sp. MPI-PUGE-AT-0066]
MQATPPLTAAHGQNQQQPQGQQTQAYEVLLFGEFVNEDGRLDAILNRLSLVCEGGASSIEFSERHFMPLVQTDGDAAGTLAVRRVKGSSGWILHSHMKPESARVHSAATVRAATFCTVEGQGLEFVSALGFVQRLELYKRGYLFRRGSLTITLLQQDKVYELKGGIRKFAAPHASAPWEVECRAFTKDIPLQPAIDAVLDLQLILKGWLDLRRQD